MESDTVKFDQTGYRNLLQKYATDGNSYDHSYTYRQIYNAVHTTQCLVPNATGNVVTILRQYDEKGADTIATIASGIEDMAREPDKFGYFLEALQKHKELIGGEGWEIASGIVDVFKDVARRSNPGKMGEIAETMKKYVPLFKKIKAHATTEVVKFIGSMAQYNPEKVADIAKAFEDCSGLINKFSDFSDYWQTDDEFDLGGCHIAYDTSRYVVDNIGRTAINTPEKLSDVAKSMERVWNLIASFDLKTAHDIEIISLAGVVNPCPLEKLDALCSIFEQNRERIKKYKDNKNIRFYLCRKADPDNPDSIDKVLRAFEQNDDIARKNSDDKVVWSLGGAAIKSPEYLEDVANILRNFDGNRNVNEHFAKMVCDSLGYKDGAVEFVNDIFGNSNPEDWGKYLGALKEEGGLFKAVANKDMNTASDLAGSVLQIKDCFGRYASDIFDYFDRRMPLYEIKTVCDIMNSQAGESVKAYMAKTKFEGRLGNKKVKPLLDAARIFSIAAKSGIGLESGPEDTPAKCYDSLASELKERFKQKYGFEVGIDRLEQFGDYIPYMEDKTIGSKIKQVLKGERHESTLVAVDVAIAAEMKQGVQNVKEELERLGVVYKKLTGESFDLGDGDISYYNRAAKNMLRCVKEWKRVNANKLDVVKNDLKELEPNLARIENAREGKGNEYSVGFAPSDTESQLISLKKVPSCLSPGGCNFRYTAHYLGDMPEGGVFFATIKDVDRVVGRATIAVGKDKNGKKSVARLSRLYPESLKISYKAFDSALKKYGEAIDATLLKTGKLEIEGVNGVAYDDRINSGDVNENTIIIGNSYNPSS